MNLSRGRSTCGPTARNASDRHRYSKNSRNESRRIDAQERAEAHPVPHGRRGPTFSERLCSSSLTAAVCTPTLRDRRISLSCTSLTRSFTEMEMLTFPLDAAFANCRFYSSSLLFPPHTIPLTSEQSGLHGAPQRLDGSWPKGTGSIQVCWRSGRAILFYLCASDFVLF